MITRSRVVVTSVATLKSGGGVVAPLVAIQGENAGGRIITTGVVCIERLNAARRVGVAASIKVKRQIANRRIARTGIGAIRRDGI